MTWALPVAWALAAAVLLPLVAHLWSRRTPRTQPFPTLRFLRAASPVSRRLRAVQDWPLLLLRVAIVVAAVAAAAGPTIATRGRVARWQAGLHRVIVVQDDVKGRVEAEVARLRRESASSDEVTTGDWDTRLVTARRLAARSAARQRTEVVFLWDGTRSRLPAGALTKLPATAGVSLKPSAAPPPAAPSFSSAGSRLPLDLVLADRDKPVAESLGEALALVPGASSQRRVIAFWPGATVRAVVPTPPLVEPELRDALAQLAADTRVLEAASRSTRDARAPSMTFPPSAQVVARGIDGAPLLRAWVDEARLAIGLEAEPTSPLALWATVAALDAVAAPAQWAAAAGDDRWTPEAIASATRDASQPGGGTLPGGLDTRAAWVLALALVIAEQWWRSALQARRLDVAPPADATEVHDAA